jgi:hypothetical protein
MRENSRRENPMPGTIAGPLAASDVGTLDGQAPGRRRRPSLGPRLRRRSGALVSCSKMRRAQRGRPRERPPLWNRRGCARRRHRANRDYQPLP